MSRIIIIDDDEDFGELTRRRLHNAGFEVTFQHGPFGSLNAIRKSACELVILDVLMPALDGPKVVQLIRDHKTLSRMKILLYSSMDPKPLRRLAEQLEVNACLSKSAPKEELVSAVMALLSVKR